MFRNELTGCLAQVLSSLAVPSAFESWHNESIVSCWDQMPV